MPSSALSFPSPSHEPPVCLLSPPFPDLQSFGLADPNLRGHNRVCNREQRHRRHQLGHIGGISPHVGGTISRSSNTPTSPLKGRDLSMPRYSVTRPWHLSFTRSLPN